MAAPAALCLLLAFPLSSSQSTPQSEQENSAHPPPAPGPPHIQELLQNRETIHLNAKQACRWSRTVVHRICDLLASDMANVSI